MIEAIAKLLKDSGLEAAQINVHLNTVTDTVEIVLNTPFRGLDKTLSEDAIALRQALSTPLILSGDVGNVDVEFNDALVRFTDAVTPSAQGFNNLVDVAVKHESVKSTADKANTEKPVTGKKSQKDTTVKESTDTQNQGNTGVSSPSTSDFYDDEVDSL